MELYLTGSENPRSRSKSHLATDNAGTICGTVGPYLESNLEPMRIKKGIVHDGFLEIPFDEYIDCRKCQVKARKNFPELFK